MGRKKAALLFGIMVSALSVSCGKPAEETGREEGTTITPEAAVKADGAENASSEPTPSFEATTASPFVPVASYHEVSPQEKFKVYISEEKGKPQVVVEKIGGGQTEYAAFDWEYNLEYGEPIVQYGAFRFNSWTDSPVLYIVLPTEQLDEALSPVGAYEICGERHIVDCASLEEMMYADNIAAGLFEEASVAEYRVNEAGKQIFTLELAVDSSDYYKVCYEYPELCLPEQEGYTIVFEETAHFTETMLSYRRIGVCVGEEVTWLGKFCNDITGTAEWLKQDTSAWLRDYLFFPEEQGYYVGGDSYYGAMPGNGVLASWRAVALQPDALFDLDGDGMPEQINYRRLPNAESGSQLDEVVFINGIEANRAEFRTCDPTADYILAAKLDGEEYQLLMLDFGVGRSLTIQIYRYENGQLSLTGTLAGSYRVSEENGTNILCSVNAIFPLQNNQVERKYTFVDGMLCELPQDYYEFLEKWGDEGEAAGRNVLTAKEDIVLRREKDGEESFPVTVGSHVVILGGDLKAWILLENCDTGERGWLRTDFDESGDAHYCILDDGRKVDAGELFEGLLRYD